MRQSFSSASRAAGDSPCAVKTTLQWVVVKATAPSRALPPNPVSDVTWSSAGTLHIQLKSCGESKLGRGRTSRAALILRQLPFREFCFFQQQRFHIGQHKPRIESRGTIDISDAAFSIDQKDPQNMI